jgi:hypothetical protein
MESTRVTSSASRDLHHVHEADAITRALLRERLVARDIFLAPLVRARDEILATAFDLRAALDALVERLVIAEREIDRHFWIDAAAIALASSDDSTRLELAQRATRRIHAAFVLGARDRHRVARLLLRALWPLA